MIKTLNLGPDPTGNAYGSGSVTVDTDESDSVTIEMYTAADNIAIVRDPEQLDALITALQVARMEVWPVSLGDLA